MNRSGTGEDGWLLEEAETGEVQGLETVKALGENLGPWGRKMPEERFRVVATGLVTSMGAVLLGRKEKDPGHPVGGEWHLPGGHVEEDEELEEALERELREEAGLDVEVHGLVDAFIADSGVLRIFYHCESESRDAEAGDDLVEVRWVNPGDMRRELENCHEGDVLDRRAELSNFLEKLEKMPSGPV